MAEAVMWLPENDGIDHINIYSKGQTELGRRLSNFSFSVIQTPFGQFESIEGYWYWLKSKPGSENRDELKTLWGFQAKKLGQTLEENPKISEEKFQFYIKEAILIKIDTVPGLKKLFKESELPFAHYYVYGDKPVHAGYEWIVEFFEFVRSDYNSGR